LSTTLYVKCGFWGKVYLTRYVGAFSVIKIISEKPQISPLVHENIGQAFISINVIFSSSRRDCLCCYWMLWLLVWNRGQNSWQKWIIDNFYDEFPVISCLSCKLQLFPHQDSTSHQLSSPPVLYTFIYILYPWKVSRTNEKSAQISSLCDYHFGHVYFSFYYFSSLTSFYELKGLHKINNNKQASNIMA